MRLTALLAMTAGATAKLPPGYRHGTHRPGSYADKLRNPPWLRRKRVILEPLSEEDWKVFKGDTVSRGTWAAHIPLCFQRSPPLAPHPLPSGSELLVSQLLSALAARSWFSASSSSDSFTSNCWWVWLFP